MDFKYLHILELLLREKADTHLRLYMYVPNNTSVEEIFNKSSKCWWFKRLIQMPHCSRP